MTTGIFSTNQFTTDHAKKSFASMITRLMPNGEAPLVGLTSRLQEESAVQTEHGFFSKSMVFPEMRLNGAIADGTTSVFTVDTTANLLPNMLLRADSTGEIVLINNVLSAVQVHVTRGVGTVAAAAIADDVYLYQVGTAFEESSYRPQALAINAVRVTNLTQTFRNTWAVSESVRQTMMIAGDTNVAENKADCATFHAVDMEKAFFWGQKSQGTRNGMPFRTMDGLHSHVNTLAYYPPYMAAVNVFAAGATTTFTQLENMLDPVFSQNTDPKVGNHRLLFVGGTAKKVINNIGRINGQYYLEHGQTEYGLQFDVFKIARGTFTMIEHPLFNSNTSWMRVAFAVDLSTFRYVKYRATTHKPFNAPGTEQATDNGIDATGGTLTTECTCAVKNPPANAFISNFTAAAVG
jgi:hypothetical protein